ncbi:MAG TPA: alpha/beta hydrolase [Anaerolineales bacterium]|nr:alpha/beta hydrolase [Anaerolineales bacterium]
MSTKTVVFIHGMYMTPLCWENWLPYFNARGYRSFSPPWPGRDKPVEALRNSHPDPHLRKLTLREVLESLSGYLATLDEKPILIGHSMGGLVVQLLLQRGLAVGGVAIDSAPPQGVITAQWSFLKSNWPHINPFADRNQPIQMSFKRFQYAFVNGLPESQQQIAFDRYVVPESRRVPGESLTRVAAIDFKKPHSPLLLVAGSADHIIPAALNRANFARYKSTGSVADFKEFPSRTHFIIGQERWEEVADSILAWIKEKGL